MYSVSFLLFLFDRNDVWRYHDYPGITVTCFRVLTRGFVIAAVLMAATIVVDKTYGLQRDIHLPPHAKYFEQHDHHASSEHHG